MLRSPVAGLLRLLQGNGLLTSAKLTFKKFSSKDGTGVTVHQLAVRQV